MAGRPIVPRPVAEQIGTDLQCKRRWYHLARWQCWGCMKYSQGDPGKMCGEIVGCNLVVNAYRKQQ